MTYSSSLALSRQQYSGRHKNAVTFRASERTLGPISNTIILIVLACLLGLMYLTQVTKTNAYGYTINDLKVKQSALQSKHDDLEVASARLQSLDRVKNSSVAAAMVPTSPSDTIN
jgi:hypothetical protein